MSSSRRTAATGSRQRNSTKRPRTTKPRNRARSGLRDVLDHFADVLAAVETVARALDAAEEDMEPAAIGAGASALRQTVRALGAVYDELDMLIVRSSTRAAS